MKGSGLELRSDNQPVFAEIGYKNHDKPVSTAGIQLSSDSVVYWSTVVSCNNVTPRRCLQSSSEC